MKVYYIIHVVFLSGGSWSPGELAMRGGDLCANLCSWSDLSSLMHGDLFHNCLAPAFYSGFASTPPPSPLRHRRLLPHPRSPLVSFVLPLISEHRKTDQY